MLNLAQQIIEQLKNSNNPLIVFPANNNGDATASALALFLFIKKMGKTPEIASSKALNNNKSLEFLPAYSEIKNHLNNLRKFIVSLNIQQAKISQIKYTIEENLLNFIISPAEGWFKPENVTTRAGEFKYDLIITLGIADLESLNELYDANIEFFYKTTIINLDHQAKNENFGQINLVDLNAIATSEILFQFFKKYKSELINEDIATCLLAGIIQQTKNFKTDNLTPRILLTTSQLITLGARREEIVNYLYRSRSIASLKLWGKILNNLKSEKNNELLWSQFKFQDIPSADININNLNEVVDELIAKVPNTKIIVIFLEQATNKTKIIIYTLKNINALELIKEYAPQGTNKSVQTTLNQSLEKTVKKIITSLLEKLDKLNS